MTLRPAIAALLPPKQLLADTLHQLLRNSKTSAWVAVGLIGLAFFFSLLELSLRRELARERTGAAIDALPTTSPQQIEFAERFAIQPRTISLEAVELQRFPTTSKRLGRSLGNRYRCRDLAASVIVSSALLGGLGVKKRDCAEHSSDNASRSDVNAHAQQSARATRDGQCNPARPSRLA